MGNYSKLFGAIIAAVLGRAILDMTGFDLASLGVAADFQQLVTFGIDAAITGFVVWAFPANKNNA